MSPANKALWFVESHFAGELSLDDVAAHAGVTRFHLSRAFGSIAGQPLMTYVRGRRLSEAARALAKGAPDILAVALNAGYNSHEAFTRAFRDQFGLTPEAVRAQGHVRQLSLVEPIKMDQTVKSHLAPPRFADGRLLLLVGISKRYDCESSAGIPALWQEFLPHFPNVAGQLDRKAYGIKYNFDDAGNFDYLCGVEVADFSRVPQGWAHLRVPEQRYAVFTHSEHISTIRCTWATIWDSWFSSSGHQAADAPHFELYLESFDAQTGTGGVEIWMPIKR
ncbi:MAG: AraC family transcriptional regulator [Gammaproteobacteria bacterium]